MLHARLRLKPTTSLSQVQHSTDKHHNATCVYVLCVCVCVMRVYVCHVTIQCQTAALNELFGQTHEASIFTLSLCSLSH